MQWNLIRFRKEKGLTQKQMADLLGISVSTYTKKESGDAQFKADEMFLLRDLFHRRLDEIFLPSNCINSAFLERSEPYHALAD